MLDLVEIDVDGKPLVDLVILVVLSIFSVASAWPG